MNKKINNILIGPPIASGDLVYFKKHKSSNSFAGIVTEITCFRQCGKTTDYAAIAKIVINNQFNKARIICNKLTGHVTINIIFEGSFLSNATIHEIIKA